MRSKSGDISQVKVPCISTTESGGEVLIYGNESAFHLSGLYKGVFTTKFGIDFRCGSLTNITREYLAGKKIKVLSPEHKDLIIDLWSDSRLFMIRDGGYMVFTENGFDPSVEYEEIHLPLPPEVKPPKDTGLDDEEWPKVGDEVIATNKGNNSLRGELLAITKEYAIIQQDGFEQHLHLHGWALEKPPTPEEELAKSIEIILAGYLPPERDYREYMAKRLMEEFDITKKEG